MFARWELMFPSPSHMLAQRAHMCAYRGATTTCVDVCAQNSGGLGLIQSSNTVFHHRAYIHIYLNAHKSLIISSYIIHRSILTGLYVSIKNIMNMQEKKLDISACLYVLIIIIAFAVGITL